MKRREFIFTSSVFTFGWWIFKNKAFAHHFQMENTLSFTEKEKESHLNYDQDIDFQDTFPYSLPRLSYTYASLEPFIDKQTMEIHHSKHHQTYINNLNKALENQSFKNAPLIEIFRQVSQMDSAIRNNGGGHYNHALFWQMLKPNPNKEKNLPSENFQKILSEHFQSFEEFKKQFSDKAAKHFGSGWCWLVAKNKKELKIVTTPNQDNPLMDVVDANDRGLPLLGLDVWEHAYYLHYQNRRAEYIENWWNIVNWDFVENRYKRLNK